MHAVTVWIAQYLLWVMVAAFVAVWVFAENRRGKVDLGVAAVVGIVLALLFLIVAKHVHHDPRPFVQNPHVKPWFGHSRDNGFPSDHSLAAAVIAVTVLWRHRITGLLLCLAAAAIDRARVAAHVHHLEDVVAGLLLGGLAAAIAILVTATILPRTRAKPSASHENTTPSATGGA